MSFFGTGGSGRGMSGYKGGYNSTESYRRNEVVTFDGAAYICIKNCTGIDPSNTEYWELFAAPGSASVAIDDGNPNTTASTLSAKVISDLVKSKINDNNPSSLTSTYSASKIESKLNDKSKVEDSVTNGNLIIDGQETIVYAHPTNHSISEVSGLQDALDSKATIIISNIIPVLSVGQFGFDTDTKELFIGTNAGNVKIGASEKEEPSPSDTTPPVVTVSPSGGIFTEGQSVILTTDESATIYYTLDGTEPTEVSQIYNNPILISTTTTLKYFAKDDSGNSSSIISETYTIETEVSQPDNEPVMVWVGGVE